MADTKITALTAITTVDPAVDVLPIVDVSDTTMAASGTTKKITSNQILGAGGTATLASATITGDLTVRTNKLAVTSVGVGLGTSSPLMPLDVRGAAGAGAVFLRTTDPTAPVSSAYIQTPVSTGFSSTVPVYGFWYQNCGMGNPANDTLNWIIGSSEQMRLNSTGLGVGTTVQYARLTVSGSNSTGIANIQNSAFASNALGTLSCYIGHDATANRPFIQAATGNAGNAFDLLIQPYGGNIGIGVTPSAGKGCLQLSSGINFPATQVASSDANTLDDYEEGTFTPTIEGHTTAGTASYSVRLGQYTKIGRLVQFQLYVSWSSGTGTGQLKVTGLPFTSNGTYPAVLQVYPIDVALVAGYYATASVPVGTSSVFMYQLPVGGGSDASVAYDAAGQLIITGTYTV